MGAGHNALEAGPSFAKGVGCFVRRPIAAVV